MGKREYLNHLASQTNVLWNLVEAAGESPGELFTAAGIDPDRLKKPLERVSCDKMNDLWALVSEKMKDPCFAVHAGEYWHPSYLNALGYAWLVSSTLNRAFEKLIRYARLLSETTVISMGRGDKDGTRVVLNFYSQGPYHANRYLASLSIIMKMCRMNMGNEFAPEKVNLTRSAPYCETAFQDYFRSDIEFSSSCDSLTFSREDMERPLAGANLHLAMMHDRVISQYLAALDRSIIAQKVKSLITGSVTSGRVTDERVAERLNMSVRSLQRQLQKEGTTFRALLDETREELARGYILAPDIRLEEVAFLTGFSEYSSFSRAFKRWTGASPGQARASAGFM